eukprot:scaffold62122_cov48-Phaeocystis_antarctica.AAC.1
MAMAACLVRVRVRVRARLRVGVRLRASGHGGVPQLRIGPRASRDDDRRRAAELGREADGHLVRVGVRVRVGVGVG